MLHKTNCVTLYLCTLEEVDHSQTKGWKSGVKSLQRQIHCDKGFLIVFLQTEGTTSWNLDCCQRSRVVFLHASLAFQQLWVVLVTHTAGPLPRALCLHLLPPLHSQPKQGKVPSLFAHAVICRVL